MNDSLFTFEALVTLGRSSYMTFLIVAYTKEIVQRLTKIPTDLYAVFTGSVVLLLAQFGMGYPERLARLGTFYPKWVPNCCQCRKI